MCLTAIFFKAYIPGGAQKAFYWELKSCKIGAFLMPFMITATLTLA